VHARKRAFLGLEVWTTHNNGNLVPKITLCVGNGAIRACQEWPIFIIKCFTDITPRTIGPLNELYAVRVLAGNHIGGFGAGTPPHGQALKEQTASLQTRMQAGSPSVTF